MKTLKTEKVFFVLFLCVAVVCLALAAGLFINTGCKKHDPVIYTVTFDTNGGSEVASKEAESGTAVAKPDDPTRDGYVFEGWVTADGEDFSFTSEITGNIKLYAKWSKDEPAETYTVTFYNGTAVYKTLTAEKGGTVAKPEDPAKDGAEFDKWITADGKEFNFAAKIEDDINVFATWKTGSSPENPPDNPPDDGETEHTVTFNLDGGASAVTSVIVKNGEKVTEPENPTKEGFDFVKWVDAEGEEFDFANTTVTSDITIKAIWETRHFTIKFNVNGGDGEIPDQSQPKDGKAIRPADPVKTGTTFEGWYTESGTLYNFDAPVTANITLIAKWADGGTTTPPSGGDNEAAAKSINFSGIALTDTITKTDGSTYQAKPYAADSVIFDIITLKGGEWEVDENTQKITDADGNEVSVTQRLKSKGKRTMDIDLSAYSGQVKLQFFVRTGSGKDLTRGVSLASSDGTKLGELTLREDKIFTFEVTVDGGSVYTLSTLVNSVNFYGINIIPV